MARGRAPKRVNQSKRRRSAASARRRREESAGIDRRGSYLATRNRPDIRTGSNNRFVAPKPDAFSGREQGIAAANTGSKEDKLQQSVGSLDRRIATALEKKDTDLAKDLRSRQNKFVKQLALERVRKTPGGTIQGNVRMSDGTRPMTTAGFDVFQDTVDRDFLDPTRRLQNLYPEQAREMYPIESRLQMGLPTVQAIKALFGVKDKPIPYSDPRMPGERYPLDFMPEGEVFAAPTENVSMEDLTDDKSVPLPKTIEEQLILPNQFDVIDPKTRSKVVDETMGDIIDSGVQDFDKLDKEFQKESAEYEKRKAEEPTFTDNYPYEVASNEPIKSLFNLFGQNDAPDDQILVDALNADMLDDGTFQSVTNPSMEEPQMQLSPIPVEDFLPEMNRQMEEDKFRLKADFPYLNDAQIEGLYNYKKGIGSKTPTSLDSNPVEFDDYMIKRMF